MPALTSKDFAAAVERYIDQEKPDRIRRTQIQSWKFQWTEVEAEEATTTTEAMDTVAFTPDHRIEGTVRWEGDYIGINLVSKCHWKGDESIVASCTARAFTRSDIVEKQSKKMQSKLLKRMQQDEMVRMLFESPLEVFDASIMSASEERVFWKEETCRAIQGSLYGAAESALEVFEFICCLPLLPGTSHTFTPTTKLADRLVLRLLEDAAYDACEAEDSDAETTVEDLTLDDEDNGAVAKRRKRS